MKEHFTLAEIDQAAAAVQARTEYRPEVGLILGSGLGGLAEELERPDVIQYQDIPFWPASTVQGHQGRFLIGNLAGANVLIQQGRAHYYEGPGYPIIEKRQVILKSNRYARDRTKKNFVYYESV